MMFQGMEPTTHACPDKVHLGRSPMPRGGPRMPQRINRKPKDLAVFRRCEVGLAPTMTPLPHRGAIGYTYLQHFQASPYQLSSTQEPGGAALRKESIQSAPPLLVPAWVSLPVYIHTFAQQRKCLFTSHVHIVIHTLATSNLSSCDFSFKMYFY